MSLTGTTKHSVSGFRAETASRRSWVKVAMPHLRGRYVPTNAILRIAVPAFIVVSCWYSFRCRPRFQEGLQQLQEWHCRKAAALVAHGIGQNQVATMGHRAATVNDIGHIPFPLALGRAQQR